MMDRDATNQSPLLGRLQAMRTAIRLRLAAYGLLAIGSGGVVAFLVVVVFDWFLHLPAALRIFAALTFFVGFVGAAWYWIIKPLRAPLGLELIAGRLERYFGGFHGRLASAVAFLQGGESGSDRMMHQVITEAESMAGSVPLESALTRRPLVGSGAAFAVSATILALILLFCPAWARMGFLRYADPFGPARWPRAVEIVPLSADQTVAVGESATVQMRVRRGLSGSLRSLVFLEEPDGSTTTVAMQPQEDGLYSATVDAITRDLRYWFEAGDDDTRDRPSLIRAVTRPVVVEALATVEPPSYAPPRPPRVRDLADGPVTAPVGGTVTVSVRSSKPVAASDGDGVVGLRTEEGSWIPLLPDGADPQSLRTRFQVTQSVRFTVELRDRDGFENRGAVPRGIVAVPDAPPTAAIVEPAAVVELTPTGSVGISLRAEDDFGLRSLLLRADRVNTAQTVETDLTERMVLTDDSERVTGTAQFVWNAATAFDEPLAAGDGVILTAIARDHCTTSDALGQPGVTAPVRIKIISHVEFEMRVRDDIAHLEARIRGVMLDQSELLDTTNTLLQSGSPQARPSAADGEVAATSAERQARLARRVLDLSRRFKELARRMDQNVGADAQTRRDVRKIGDALRREADGALSAAAARLQEARERRDADAWQEALTSASRDQRHGVERLDELARAIARWDNFRSLVTKTRDLLERQDAVRRATTQLGKRIIGRSVDSLGPVDAAALSRIRRRQEQLANDAVQLLEHMARLAGSKEGKDPSGAAASEAALRAARAHDTTKHLRDAARAIETNRTAAAGIEQKRAMDGLAKTLATLQQRDRRELERLRKNIEQAGETVARLIEDQEALRDATKEWGVMGRAVVEADELRLQQGQLQRNAGLLGDELVDSPRVAPAGRIVRQAVQPMSDAGEALSRIEAGRATTSQDEAIDILREALERLDRIARETDEEAFQRTLAEIHEDLQNLRDAQADVNEGITELRDAIAQAGRIGRSQARRASKLSRLQREARRLVDEILTDVEKVIVYRWALDRIAGWMDDSRRRFDARRIDDELSATTARILSELDKLIAAIVETKAIPASSEFAEAEGDGGGASNTGSSKPVPTVAELLVLRAMQRDINERTTALEDSFDPLEATEAQLRRLKEIGEDQTEVRRLAEMVTKRARMP